MIAPHVEKNFESYIAERLHAQGWRVGDTAQYDTLHALYPDDLAEWLKTTQPRQWDKLCHTHGADPMGPLMDRLVKALEQKTEGGTVGVLRHGFSIAGCGHLDLSESAPEDARNADVLKRYAANILRVVPQLKYHPTREFAIDLVFFINGLPVATVEVKTDFTQSAQAAVEQYKKDRRPFDPKTRRHEPLLTFKRGAVVHFALSDSEIRMATKLDGDNTFFLPFNLGHDGHAGNPPRADGEYPVAYFWERVCQRDAWLRIFHSFVYVEKRSVADLQGNWHTKETLIFPRFHQWDAVNRMIADAKAKGAGQQYLCEHSAGSGKTSTIAWTAYDLIKLRSAEGAPLFDSVVIVTDRTVLDDQLRDAVKQLDHQFGVIAAIDRQKSGKPKSAQLAEALTKGVPIIVVTLQTFPYALEQIIGNAALKDRHFAVIIDEAHNSQSGASAAHLNKVLGLGSSAGENLTVEDLLERLQQARVQPKNVSHFAFTATPKHSTFMLFGRSANGLPASKENLPQAFHRYPMRQAIEEGFILDVLKGYTPYQTAFNLARQIEDTKRVGGKAARRALARWMTLHPTNVTQKVEFIVEHFARSVAPMLAGAAKAMVVTSSRAAAVRYKLGFDAYIELHPVHAHIRSLVAFSGKLTGKEVKHGDDALPVGDAFAVDTDAEFTETSMNPGLPSSDLRKAFDRPEYRVMLVADKFQTGFDQPKLVAMYVDKKIANDVEIVQTFSRLNRTAPGKDRTFIIDFVNAPENVQRAFAKYDGGAQIEDVQDPNVLYEIRNELDAQAIYEAADLEQFKQARFGADPTGITKAEHKALYTATEGPTQRYTQRKDALYAAAQQWETAWEQAHAQGNVAAEKQADHERKRQAEALNALLSFRGGLGRFCSAYAYIAQLVDLGDPELENFAAFARLLSKRLDGIPADAVDLSGLMLSGFDIKPLTYAQPSDDPNVPAMRPLAGPYLGNPDEPEFMREIIRRLNELYGDVTPPADQIAFTNHVADIAWENETVRAQVENSSKQHAMQGSLPGAVKQAALRTMDSNEKLATPLLKEDGQMRAAFTDLIYDLLRQRIAEQGPGAGQRAP